MYGLTEAFRATYLPPEEADRRPDSIGRAIPGSEILVLREDLTRVRANEVGELVQRGPDRRRWVLGGCRGHRASLPGQSAAARRCA